MIELLWFAYTDEQWDAIKVIVRDQCGPDADQMEWPILSVLRDRSVRDLARGVAGMAAELSSQPLCSALNKAHGRRVA